MQMMPFFPPLRLRIPNRLWLEGSYVNEEAQVARYEREHRNWVSAASLMQKRDSIKNAAADVQPIGKVLTMPGIETDDEDGNDDSEDSDSHDDEDEETNFRVVPGAPSDFYSAPDETHPNEDVSAPVA